MALDLPSAGATRKMSKKEKRFHLLKDDGRYTELNPISPHDAQKEFGESLRLNPVHPKGPGEGSGTPGVELPDGGASFSSSSAVPQPGGMQSSMCIRGCVFRWEVT